MSIELMTKVWKTDVGPATRRLVLLALADSANDDGVCWPSVETLARKAGCGVSSARRACQELEADGFLVREERDANGRQRSNLYRLSLSAIEGAQIERAPKLSGTGRPDRAGGGAQIERQNPNRETKEGTPTTETSPPADGGLFPAPLEPAAPKPEELLAEEFEAWWKAYPRKVGKGAAQKAYKSARKDACPEELANGLRRASIAWEAARTAPQYVPHASTWLNGQRWLDDPAAIAHAGDARGAYRNDAWDRDAAAERDEDGYTEEDRMIMEKYGAKIGYGNSNAPAK